MNQNMPQSDFEKLKESIVKSHGRREAGLALLLATLVLSATLLIPTAKPAVVATATPERVLPNTFANIPLTAKAAIVYDLSTGETLYAKNAEAQLPLASITKLLTTYAAVHELGLATPITLTPSDIATEGSSGLVAGESFSLDSLAQLSLVVSSNDGAAALARTASERAGKSDAEFLSAAAAAASLSQTYALDGSGLDLSAKVSGGYGSASDVAKLAGALLKEAPSIADATTETSVSITSLAGITHTVKNTNPFVANLPGILLSKTGSTDLAGGNLVVVLDVGMNHPVAIVALGSTDKARFTDVNTLAAATLAHFSATTLATSTNTK